jgi:uncharacterized protein
MMHPDTELRFIDSDIGYGVFATAPIPRGTVVWVLCRLDRILTPAELAALPLPYLPIVEKYAYVNGDQNQVLCWDHARYLNHSCRPSMRGLGSEFEIAVRNITPGEHITCEYGALNLTQPMQCRCGAPGCRHTIGRDDVLTLSPLWDREVAESLPFAAGVAQPLLPFACGPEQFRDWVDGKAPLPSLRDYHAGSIVRPPELTPLPTYAVSLPLPP